MDSSKSKGTEETGSTGTGTAAHAEARSRGVFGWKRCSAASPSRHPPSLVIPFQMTYMLIGPSVAYLVIYARYLEM